MQNYSTLSQPYLNVGNFNQKKYMKKGKSLVAGFVAAGTGPEGLYMQKIDRNNAAVSMNLSMSG